MLIHVCKHVTDAEKDSINEKVFNKTMAFYTNFVDQFINVYQTDSLIKISQNLIQSMTSLFMKYVSDDRTEGNTKIMKAIMDAYNYYTKYYENHYERLRENIIFCYKRGYIQKFLRCLSVCSEGQNVLDTLKSCVCFRTTRPIFTDEEKLSIFKIAKKGLLDLTPLLNYDFAIQLTKDLYLFLPNEVDGMSSYEAVDRMLVETLIAFWKSPFETSDEKKALVLFEKCFSESGEGTLKWATPESVRKIIQESPITPTFFAGKNNNKKGLLHFNIIIPIFFL